MNVLKTISALLFFLIFSSAQAEHSHPSLHQEILQLGCETIGEDGFCDQDTYDLEMPFSELIEQTRMEVIYDHNRLRMTLIWDEALRNVKGLASDSFLEKVKNLRHEKQIQSIIQLHPYPEFCPEDENCEYAYLFLYLKDGSYFFFHWVKESAH